MFNMYYNVLLLVCGNVLLLVCGNVLLLVCGNVLLLVCGNLLLVCGLCVRDVLWRCNILLFDQQD